MNRIIGQIVSLLLVQIVLWGSNALAAPSCQGIFSTAKVVSLGSEPSPQNHIFNVERAFNKLRESPAVRLTAYKAGENTMLSAGDGVSFVLDFVSEPRRTAYGMKSEFIVIRDVNGRLFRAPVIAESVHPAFYQVDFTKLEMFPEEIVISPSRIQNVRDLFDQFGMSQMSATELAELLTALQLKTSTKASSGGVDFSNAIFSANRIFYEILKSKENLTVENLERINLLANTGLPVLGSGIKAIFVGVLRGTRKIVQFQGQEYLVDNSDIQLRQSEVKLNIFLPASEVPARINHLLEKVNAVKSGTELETIFGIYNEFIRIHPFIDGNGRTGRMLLNFMLVKAGFIPTRVASESLYFSNADLVLRYLENLGE